jgi:hypothetical protein
LIDEGNEIKEKNKNPIDKKKIPLRQKKIHITQV